MSKQFLNKEQITLLNGGYLSNKKDKSPITNFAFVSEQKHAEYIITFAKLAKGKDFVGKKVDSLQELKQEVNNIVNKKNEIQFVKKPKAVKKELGDKLFNEAMAFIDYEKSASKVDKINMFLQDNFTVLKDFNEYGLFFEEGIIKLNKIYTLAEVISAVEETIDLVN